METQESADNNPPATAPETAEPLAGQPAPQDGATAPATPPPGRSPLRPLQRMLVRGEASIASVGLSLAAIFMLAMGAAGWWTLRAQQDAAAAARDDQVKGVANLLVLSTEPLLANNELTAVRRIVGTAGPYYNLSACRIVLSDGQVIADSSNARSTVAALPESWAAGHLPPPAPEAKRGTSPVTLPMTIGDRGKAELQIVGNADRPAGAVWETQAGLGSIGAFTLIAVLLVYRRMRSRLRAVGAVREALLALRAGQVPPEAMGTSLLVSPSLGPEALAWNDIVSQADKARRLAVADKVRDALGRRRQGKGDLDAACDAMSHGLMLVDERNRVKYANGAAAAFLRADRNQLTGSEVERFLDVPSVLEAVRSVANGTLRRRTIIDVERREDPNDAATDTCPGPAASGVLRFSIRPVRRDDSASAMLIIEDVTQQKAAEEARHSFVAQATHELRTPLTNIRLYVETAIEDGENDPATRAKCLNVINGEARRLERIVGEMLSVAEIEAGSFKLKSDDVRLDAMFEELRQDFAEQAKEKQIRLVFNLPPKLPVLQGDRDKVNLALHNLVGNALKYTPSSGTVWVEVEADAKRVAVAVKDTGIGISPEDQERIFERFYRAKDSRVAKITGTGLGLTLAREVARLHGGEITVDSVLNQGSTFTLVLPAAVVA